jgi:hypothetical protein
MLFDFDFCWLVNPFAMFIHVSPVAVGIPALDYNTTVIHFDIPFATLNGLVSCD